ncbi:MAG TPA: Asp-tRNA(Asn)/Glu-tRNA(Gln) amidotransferase subunit GatC [Phototrophicaceae bacterium]|nr:Asp-tRNA(Asn)/Glu-tRNA(Gln) amidotransferase subunit GatC [Phototrophicaceae bacterium]
MELSHETVRAIADLAKLELSDAEVARYAGQLSHILQYFEKLQMVDTSQIEPIASVLPLKNVLRPDIAGQPLTPEKAIANAADAQDNQFRVSAVLDE